MVSRRNFFVIFLMMAVLLFMFQFSQIIKENGNEYDTNEYYIPDLDGMELAYTVKTGNNPQDFKDDSYVFYLAGQDATTRDTVLQWCTYTKRNLLTGDSLKDVVSLKENLPEIILIDGKTADVFGQMRYLETLAGKQIMMVFLNLPDVSMVQVSKSLQEFLGLEEIRSDHTYVEGIRLFSGLFLGGEAVYKATTEKEEELQDFSLEMPWYITGKGTKTYMVGLKDEKVEVREEFPRLVWRNNYRGAMIYAIAADYCDDLTGLGFLDAFVYETDAFVFYPVVNAQNTIVADYPALAKENNDVMEAIYSRDSGSALRDIIWPGILSMSTKNKLKLTCFVQTKYSYNDPAMPENDKLTFYLQQLKESGAEAGRTLNYEGSITLSQKATQDESFLNGRYDYCFGAIYSETLSEELKDAILSKKGLSEIHTLTCADRGDYPLLSYYTDSVTLLGVTNAAEEYSYRTDLRMRSLATALGYSNVLVDMHRVLWPESDEDHWQNYFDEVFSNISTYFTRYSFFDQTTMSECDLRTRSFLNLNYSMVRQGDIISLQVTNKGPGAYFVFRTHGEKIGKMTGGDYKLLTQDFYLLHITDENVRIELKRADEVLQYDGPF